MAPTWTLNISLDEAAIAENDGIDPARFPLLKAPLALTRLGLPKAFMIRLASVVALCCPIILQQWPLFRSLTGYVPALKSLTEEAGSCLGQ